MNEEDPTPLLAHLRHTVEKHLEQLEDCRDFASARDPVEAVHDLRVASRRLRAFADLASAVFDVELRARAKKTLRSVTKIAGRVRDLDVQAAHLGERRDAASDTEQLALDHLQEWLALKRDRAARRAARKLRGLDFSLLRRGVERVLEEVTERLRELPAGESPPRARAHLLELTEAAESCAVRADGADPDESIHRLRISVKHLRYSVELLEPVLGERFAALDARARELQELLGDHHDLVVLAEVLGEHVSRLGEKERPTLARAVDVVRRKIQAEKYAKVLGIAARGFDGQWWRAHL